MARPLRIEFPGAPYHAISPGNERRPGVRDDEDRAKRLDCASGGSGETAGDCGRIGGEADSRLVHYSSSDPKRALPLSRKVLGPEHLNTLMAMNNLAISYDEVGRRDEAVKLQEEALPLNGKVLGPEHPQTLSALSNLALSYARFLRHDDALKLREEALALSRKVLGPEHPSTSMMMLNLACTYDAVGRNADALKLLEEGLTLCRKVNPPGHRCTLLTMICLAQSYEAVCRYVEALDLELEVLAISLKQNPSSGGSPEAYVQLGFSLEAAGRIDDAIKAWQEAMRIDPAILRNTGYWLGKALVARRRYAEALPVLRASREFFPDGEYGRGVAELLALAESKAETESTPAGAADPESLTAWLAGLREWAAASPTDKVAALRREVAADPADTEKARRLALVHVWLGETDEHLAICRKLLETAANSTEPTVHDRAAKAYLLQGHPDPETLKKAAASARQALNRAAPNDASRGCFLVTAALAAIRDAAPADAEPLLTEALGDQGGDRALRSVALACRAMARARLGRTDDARADFAELENIKPAFPAPPAVSSIVLYPDAVAVGLLYEEAKALLNTARTSGR